MKSEKFKAAAEAKDIDSADGLFRDDVVFRSPFVFRAYEGIDALRFILSNVVQVFEDFSYIAHTETDDVAVLMFEARVGDREVQGVDILRYDEDGLIAEMTVMIRPMSGLEALGTEMRTRMEALGVEPG
jgi:hypothetical protein